MCPMFSFYILAPDSRISQFEDCTLEWELGVQPTVNCVNANWVCASNCETEFCFSLDQ